MFMLEKNTAKFVRVCFQFQGCSLRGGDGRRVSEIVSERSRRL